MITEEYLNNFREELDNNEYELKKTIKEIRKHEANIVVDSVRGTSKEYPFTDRHYTVIGIEQKSQKILKKLKLDKKYLEKKHKKLTDEFDYRLKDIKDKRLVEIIELRFKKNLSWSQIALQLKYTGESIPRMKFNRFIGKV